MKDTEHIDLFVNTRSTGADVWVSTATRTSGCRSRAEEAATHHIILQVRGCYFTYEDENKAPQVKICLEAARRPRWNQTANPERHEIPPHQTQPEILCDLV